MRIPFLTTKSITTIPDDDAALLEAFTGSTPGAGVTPQVALNETAVQAAVKLISESCAALDVNIVDGEARVSDHPALDLLRGQVNGWTSGYEFIRDMVAESLLHDSGAMAWVNRVNGEPREIINYRRGKISFQEEETRELLYRVSGRPVPAGDIVHLRGPLSKCPITLAREAIGASLVMTAHASRMFKNGAKPGLVIETPKGFGEKAYTRMKAGWRAAHEGSENSGKTAILMDGATAKQMQLSSVDAQFLEMRRFQIEEIGRAFNISPAMLGDLTKSSYANASQKQLEFLQYAVEPWLKALESALDRALLSDKERGTMRFRFDRDDLTRASLTERATAINSLIASEVINPNEGRDWLGMPAREGGDVYANRNITVKPGNDTAVKVAA